MYLRILIFAFVSCVSSKHENSVYMSRTALDDQASAATGFVYHTNSNGPVSYMQFNSATGNLQKFGYPPITLGHYNEAPKLQPLPLPYLPKLYPDQLNVQLKRRVELQDNQAEKHNDEDETAPAASYNQEFYKENGAEHNSEQNSSNGVKDLKGYVNNQEFDEGSKGQYKNEEKEGSYNENGSSEQGNQEQSENYNSKHESGKGSKGGSFGEANSHKKGSKTTGYHKVYCKDEYKKDHTFYDESDSRGQYDKYGNEHSHHSSEEGGHKNAGQTKSAHHDGNFSKKGYYDKGHHNSNNSGHKGEKGAHEYYKDNSNYANDRRAEKSLLHGHENEDNDD